MIENKYVSKFIDKDPPSEAHVDRSFGQKVLDYLAYLKETLNFIFANYGRRLTDAAGNINELIRTSDETTSRLTDAEGNIVEISQHLDGVDSELSTKVSVVDYNGEVISSLINQSASSVKILANHISLAGSNIDLTGDNITITSDNFSVDSEGNVVANNAYLSGRFRAEKTKTFWASDYTEEDLEKVRDIVYGNVTPTDEDYEKYDINLDGKIGMSDVIKVRNMVVGAVDKQEASCYVEIAPGDANWIEMGNNSTGIDTAISNGRMKIKEIKIEKGGIWENNLQLYRSGGQYSQSSFEVLCTTVPIMALRAENRDGEITDVLSATPFKIQMEGTDWNYNKKLLLQTTGLSFFESNGDKTGTYPPNFFFFRKEVTLNTQYCVLDDYHFRTDSIVFAQTLYSSNEVSLTATVTPQVTTNGACILYFRMPSGTIADGTKVNVQVLIIGGTV